MNTEVDPKDPIGSEELARYVSGEADAEQRARVEAWAAADAVHRRELDAMLSIWELGAGPSPEVDVDAAWLKLSDRMRSQNGKGRVITFRDRRGWWAAAAAVLIGLFFVGRSLTNTSETLVAGVETTTSVLDDSTRVVISPNSRLEVSMGRTRHVELTGQAWFEVARDEKHPFVVRSDDLKVTVLGTGFEVSAYDTAGTWTVRVRHGRVRVEADTQRVELTAGQRVILDRATGRLLAGTSVTTETWGDRIVRFENAPMSEVTAELQRMFHVRVDLANEAMGRCRLTATFENETIEQVLRVIAGTFGSSVEHPANDHYVLRGDGC